MFNKILSKAVSKDNMHPAICNVYYDKNASKYIAINGHIMLIESTSDTYDQDKFLSPLTGLGVECSCTFPDWSMIVPEDSDLINERKFLIYTRTEKSKQQANKIAQIGELHVNYDLLKIVLDFIGSDFILTNKDPRKPLKFRSLDGLRIALLMPIYQPNLKKFVKNQELLDACQPCAKQAKVKYVYIAYDESGAVRGIFSKITDARKEATGKVQEYPIL